MRNKIPVHHNELQARGIELLPFSELSDAPKIPHRDDHYMLMLQHSGTSVWTIDFKEYQLEETCLCFVAPGQVHQYAGSKNTGGWLVFVESELVPSEYRIMLDTFMYHHQIVHAAKDHSVFTLADILSGFIAENKSRFYQSILQSSTSALMGMFTTAFIPEYKSDIQLSSHKYQLITAFKELIKQHFKQIKQVKDYAAQLNITPLYLNETVKDITGFVASYWIQKEILLEAQRLLFYTDMDIKEIAFALGYEDHTYFSRFFKKNIGITASEFRKNNHYLSNYHH
ncbi:helix-turn-helix domain-containing protein [Chryseobacterium sp. MIQD13]|uniref:helix-turn-helix domain-containing protein n=1 Tax=Chryseobacterium sp. MIQD13 TaxID=3422310 RepID=UPI003D2A0D57